jgi:excisionase family DNA binding protein
MTTTISITSNELITISEAARQLKVTRATLYNWMRETPPRISTVSIGRNRYVPIAEVSRLSKKN